MAKSVSARDKQIASSNTTLSQTTSGVREQVISITDLISEGPIFGLVDAEASVFLDDDRAIPAQTASTSKTVLRTVSLTNGSTSGTLSSIFYNGINDTTRRLFHFPKAAESTVTLVIGSQDTNFGLSGVTITSATSFFDNTWMITGAGVSQVSLVIYDNDREVSRLFGTINAIASTTSATFLPNNANNVITKNFISEASGKTVKVEVGRIIGGTITVGTTNVTFDSAWQGSTGSYEVNITSFISRNNSTDITNSFLGKFSGVTAQFRVGDAFQDPMTDFIGVSNTQIPSANFSPAPLEYIDSLSKNPSDTAATPPSLRGTSSAGFGLTSQQAREADEVRLTFTYPAMQNISDTSGNTGMANAIYKIELTIERGSESSTVVLVPRRLHQAESTTPISFEEVINLEPFKPFTDFVVTVTRLTRHDGRGVQSDGSNKKPRYSSQQASSSITSVLTVIKENLTYPYSAYANVTFNSKEFSSVPTRTYHARGMKVLVPSNYTTREESINAGNGIAVSDLYNGLWDGSFREDKVYTNNPAWIFYDIVTNNRYGLGDWIQAADIDKYTLYRVARYCDELVTDGQGGQEPRFTSNIYLTKAADAYKVLKDMASAFVGMIYWMDGQITPVIDQPKDPVYTFSKGNVIDGQFTYESTGSKTRANQIYVNWNNPDANYQQEVLLVEDRENIVKTGRIITEDAVAFGCTSQAQAQRYGRWKLWTAANQTEVVSFKTSINAAFLTPGDVIKLQDADRYAVQYSGRISGTGTLNTTSIPLDRTITLNAGSTYSLSVLIEGDSTEDGGADAPTETLVETRTVSTSPGSVSALTVSSAFTYAPTAGSVWVLKETTSEGTVASSAKDYKILAITEDSKEIYSITAVEHYNEKFTAIEEDFTLVLDEQIVSATETVPAPANVYIKKFSDPTKAGDEFSISWDVPDYDKISGYEISHTIPNYPNPIQVSSSVNRYAFSGVEDGTYSVSVRTLNTINNKSLFTTLVFNIEDPYRLNVPRAAEGIGIGGTASSELFLSSTYNLNFKDSTNVTISPIVDPTNTFSGSVSELNTISENLTGVGTYYVLFDQSVASLIAINYNTSAAHKVNYWYNAIDANGSPEENTFTTLSGSVTISANSTKVTGAGTSFTSTLVPGDIIRLNSTTAAKVVEVVNNTLLFIDRGFSTAYTQSSYARNALRIDPEKDVIVAEFTKAIDSTDPLNIIRTSTFKSYLSLDKSLQNQFASVASDNLFITYNQLGEQEPTFTNNQFTLTATAYGFDNPEFQITGAGFSQVDEQSEDVIPEGEDESVWNSPTSGSSYEKTLTLSSTEYSADNLLFTVTVREATNTSKQATVDFVLVKIKQGMDARSVKLIPNNGQVISYDADGTTETTTLTFTAVPEGFSGTVTYEFYLGNSETAESVGVVGDTFTLQDTDEPASGAALKITVKALEDGIIKASDIVTVYGVKDGTTGLDAVFGFLTNESHSEAADNSGTLIGNLDDAGGVFKTFVGTTDVTGNASVAYSVVSNSGISANIGTTGTYSLTNFTGDKGVVTFRAVIDSSLIPNSDTDVTIDKTYSISKSKTGDEGNKTATARLYTRSSSTSAPSVPTTGSANYTFGSGITSETIAGWETLPITETTGKYLWATEATIEVVSTATTATISASSFGTPFIVSSDGENGSIGVSAVQASATNTNHTFIAGTDGIVTNNNFSCSFSVRKEDTTYTYAGTGTTANTYGILISGESNCSVINTSGTLTIAATSDILDVATQLDGSFIATIIDRGDSDRTIAEYRISLSKVAQAFRDGGIFTFTGYNATYAAAWAGSLTTAAAQAVAASVIAASSDGYISPNDRITVTDGTNAATRIYTGSRTNSSGSVGTGSFSSVVTEVFDGSVIVDGTLSADKLTANATFTNNLNVNSTMTLGAVGGTGIFNTPNKTSYSDTDNGFYLDTNANFYLGNATDYLKFDTTNGLQVQGSFSLSSLQEAGAVTSINGINAVNGSVSLTIPADLQDLTDNNALLFSGSYNDLSNLPALFSGDYGDLLNPPTIPSDLQDLTDTAQLLFSGNYVDLINKPTIPSDIQELADANGLLFSGDYGDLLNLPTLFSGDYGDLLNPPTIPTNLSDLTNDINALLGIDPGSTNFVGVSAQSQLTLNPTSIVGATTAIVSINTGSSTYASISSNELTIVPSAITLAGGAITAIQTGSTDYLSITNNQLTLTPSSIVLDGGAVTSIATGNDSYLSITNNQLSLTPSAITLAGGAVTSVASANSTYLSITNNELTLTPANINITSFSGVGDLATKDESELDFISSETNISAGKIVLASGTLDFTTGTPTKNNTIVMDTTSGNNAIEIYDGTTLRVKIGKL